MKMPTTMNLWKLASIVLLTILSPLTAMGQADSKNYPNKVIRLIVPFAPGGTTDIIARTISDPLGKIIGTSVIVENKAGGGGITGAAELSRMAPDGYTLGIATVSTTASNPAVQPNIPYNPIADFSYIINLAATPNIIAINPSFPAKNYAEFVAELKKHPSKYSYASSGVGGIGHLQTELYKSLAKVEMTHIPYSGAGPALRDTVAGQVPIMFDNVPSTLPHVKAGKLIALAVAAPNRLEALPSIPTFKELGLEPVNRMAYYGIAAPKGIPVDIVGKIHAAMLKVLADPAVKSKIEQAGSIIVGNTPSQFLQQVTEEYQVYLKVVKESNIKM